MSKELKALEVLKQDVLYDEELEVIEKALKALEVIKNLPQEEKQILLNAIYTYTKSEEKYDLVKEELL